ncbi:MAG: hypothetical protein WA667_13755 [Candidatus Nitrosopolaris sp.]
MNYPAKNIANKIIRQFYVFLLVGIDGEKLRYDVFVRAYNETREHGEINGLTPSEMFLQRLIK